MHVIRYTTLTMGMIGNLEAMLSNGHDNALLRFTLGSMLLKQGDIVQAVMHLREAVDQDPGYSAAWKAYGKALQVQDDFTGACKAFAAGIAAATDKGDVQAAKEMKVFLKRVQNALADNSGGF